MWQEVASSPAFSAAFPWLILLLGAAGCAVVFGLLREEAGPNVRPARSAPPPPTPVTQVGLVGLVPGTAAYAVEADIEGLRLEHAQLILNVDPPPVGEGAEAATVDSGSVPGALRARLLGHVSTGERGEPPPEASLVPLEPLGHVAVQVCRSEPWLNAVALATATVEREAPSRLGGRYVALAFAEPDARELCAALGLEPPVELSSAA